MFDSSTGTADGRPGWISALLGDAYSILVVEDVDERTALIRLGVQPRHIRERTVEQVPAGAGAPLGRDVPGPAPDPAPSAGVVLAARFGRWTVLLEENGTSGADRGKLVELSRGVRAACCYSGANGDTMFGYAEDGGVTAWTEDVFLSGTEGSPALATVFAEAGVPADADADVDHDDYDFGAPERVVCAIAGLGRLTDADFRGRVVQVAGSW